MTASGLTTNLVARIAAFTEGGEILIGPETARCIRTHFVLADVDPQHLKNVSEPIQVFRPVSPGVYAHIRRA